MSTTELWVLRSVAFIGLLLAVGVYSVPHVLLMGAVGIWTEICYGLYGTDSGAKP